MLHCTLQVVRYGENPLTHSEDKPSYKNNVYGICYRTAADSDGEFSKRPF